MKQLTFAAFFFAKRPGKGRVAITRYNPKSGEVQTLGYIRVKLFKGCTNLEALDKSKPRRGESLMNTHEV